MKLVVETNKEKLNNYKKIGAQAFIFGLESFSSGYENPLTNSSGEKRKRDIVQFVEFNKYKDKDLDNCGPHLAEEVLKEIPRQVEEYYQFCGEFYE